MADRQWKEELEQVRDIGQKWFYLGKSGSILGKLEQLHVTVFALAPESKSFIISSILKSCGNKKRGNENFVSLPHSYPIVFKYLVSNIAAGDSSISIVSLANLRLGLLMVHPRMVATN